MQSKASRPKTPPLFVRTCRLCGVRLGFGQTHMGRSVPIDLEAEVYTPVFEKSDSHGLVVVRTQLAFVSHWETCKVLNGEDERKDEV